MGIQDKRVIFINDSLYPYNTGGLEVFNYYLMQKLKNEYSITVISPYECPPYITQEEYVQIKRLKPEGIFHPLKYCLQLSFFRKKSNCLLVLTFARSRWFNWWTYPLVKKLFGIEYIIVIHGGGLTKWKWSYPFRQLFSKAARVIGVSERICEEYKLRTGINVEFIPPLVPFETYSGTKEDARIKWGLPGSSFICLSVGSLKELKNPDTIIKAAIKLGSKFILENNIIFVFAGDGVMKQELEKNVAEEGLENNFVFLGNVRRECIASLYAASDTFIMGSDYEGTPISMLEAMHNKLVILASNAPGINSIIVNGQNGFLFETKNELMLAKHIKEVATSDFSYLGRNARDLYLQYFSFERMLIQYRQIIDSI